MVLKARFIHPLILQQYTNWCVEMGYGELAAKFASGRADKNEIQQAKDKTGESNCPATYAATYTEDIESQSHQIIKLLELIEEKM